MNLHRWMMRWQGDQNGKMLGTGGKWMLRWMLDLHFVSQCLYFLLSVPCYTSFKAKHEKLCYVHIEDMWNS